MKEHKGTRTVKPKIREAEYPRIPKVQNRKLDTVFNIVVDPTGSCRFLIIFLLLRSSNISFLAIYCCNSSLRIIQFHESIKSSSSETPSRLAGQKFQHL